MLPLPLSSHDRIRRFVEQMHRLRPESAMADMLELAVHILRRYAGKVLPAGRGASTAIGRRLERARDYIEANLKETLSLDSIAEAAALSPYHFSRTFKAATGLSPHRYVTLRRVELAKMLLVSTRLPLVEVARHVGIPNQSHFTTQFRKLAGCTPKAFRGQG